MIRRIILQNYMSHVQTVIEPAAGLTVLTGPNNCGKSAVVSALETLCSNATKSYMVRHGQKEARVTVETDDGHTVTWKRKGSTVSYVIDGREIHRLKGDVPEELHKVLRLPKVEPGEKIDPFDIHFGPQKFPIFLLNEPESRAALFFASSSDAAILLEMQKRHRTKVKDKKNEERWLRAEVEKLDVEIDTLKPLDALAESISQVEARYRDIEESAAKIKALHDDMETLRSRLLIHERQKKTYSCFAALMPPPTLEDTASLAALIAELLQVNSQVQQEMARRRTLENLATPPQDLHDAENLKSLWEELESALRANASLHGRQQALAKLSTLPELPDPTPLADLICKLEESLGAVALCNQTLADTNASMKQVESELRVAERHGRPPVVSAGEKKNQRLEQVRKLLDDAALAIQHENYLDAIFGFGQAAILFPEELAEAENPATVRDQFNLALSGYQAEVERALRKAAKHKLAETVSKWGQDL
ncbi:MAG: AAA family ATPase [Planctomycetes bacterium]|nr:AAA family ATPase [Planctomycetota bacterium]